MEDKNAPEHSDKKPPSSGKSKADKEKRHSRKKYKRKERKESVSRSRTPSPASSLATPEERRRTPSPFRKNVVEPVVKPGEEPKVETEKNGEMFGVIHTATTMGSVSSLRSSVLSSHSSIKANSESLPQKEGADGEAWPDNRRESEKQAEEEPGPSGSLVSVKEATQENRLNGFRNKDGVNLTYDGGEQHAYIPYMYARNCIAKIMDDMKNMKTSHVTVVHGIETHFRSIEDETQSQFNTFVLSLRRQYSDKVQTFRQVIDVHRTELQEKEAYWNEMLASLVERNKKLLKDKKALLVQSKLEAEKLEKEKAALIAEHTLKLERAKSTLSSGSYRKIEEENKKMKDELQKEKDEMEQLKKHLSESTSTTGTVVLGASVDEGRQPVNKIPPVIGLSTEEKNKIEKERKDMEEERKRIETERHTFDEERTKFTEERKKWLDDTNKQEADVDMYSKELVELKARYESIKTKAEQASTMQKKYQALEAQYQALAAVVANSEQSQQAAEDRLRTTEQEKGMLRSERQKLEADIRQWEAEFRQKNGRKPADKDRSDVVEELFVQREEIDTMVKSLDQKMDTLHQLQRGTVPKVPEVPPVFFKEPEIKTVEVKVKDRRVVEELDKAQTEIARLHAQISALQQERSYLSSQLGQRNEELSKQGGRIGDLEAQLASLKAVPTALGPMTGDNQEYDTLRNENRELKKDMKKMLMKYEKLQGRETDTKLEPGEQIGKLSALEEKNADLEAENETLKEDKKMLLNKMKSLQASEDKAVLVGQVEERNKQLEEKDKSLDSKDKELERLKKENREMLKDMKKMIRSQAKLQTQLQQATSNEETKRLLKVLAGLVHEIHDEVPSAAAVVVKRLEVAEKELPDDKTTHKKCQRDVDSWCQKYKKKHKTDPTEQNRDAEAEKLYKALEDSKGQMETKELQVQALHIIKSGDVRETTAERRSSVSTSSSEKEVEKMEQQLSSLDDKVTDLESENENLKEERNKLHDKIKDLEWRVEDAKKQAELQSTLAASVQETEDMSDQMAGLQKQVGDLEAALLQERSAHDNTRDELDSVRKQLQIIKEELDNEKVELAAKLESTKQSLGADVKSMAEELRAVRARNEKIEEERLSQMPLDTAKEIRNLKTKLTLLEKEKTTSGKASGALQAQITELQAKLDQTVKNLETQRSSSREMEAKLKSSRNEKDQAVRETVRQVEKREQQRANEDKKRLALLEKKVKELDAGGARPGTAGVAVVAAGGPDTKGLKDQLAAAKRENNELNTKIKQLEAEIKNLGRADVDTKAKESQVVKRHEKILKELEKKYEHEKKKLENVEEALRTTEDERKAFERSCDEKDQELKKLRAELQTLSMAAKEGVEAAHKVRTLESDNKKLSEENRILTENYNTERVLRKKYYNMVEDMKGKIRVYCRARPMSRTELERGNYCIMKSPDEYTINLDTSRGPKEFQFDQIFMEDSTQEKIFEDSNNLIQSAVDGYNVCIFAYGQTGSGKTYTMIGESEVPGIAPRAFTRIFELGHENRTKFDMSVTCYMLELYNEKLIDLFARPGSYDDEKLEIHKDKKEMVYIKGAVVKEARNAKELLALFEEGTENRHTASTKMNMSSSRSHLVIGILMESVNKLTGQVTRGKLSLVDLAGSERVAKTQSSPEQLKEAMSINKSLSALGDVISALSSEQSFIPYRNNKLTMLMQDSLGGNAKTLMFVNVSPADYNTEESVISLTYASRVKLITNDATKNADNKEIARLKGIIAKLRQGEQTDEEI